LGCGLLTEAVRQPVSAKIALGLRVEAAGPPEIPRQLDVGEALAAEAAFLSPDRSWQSVSKAAGRYPGRGREGEAPPPASLEEMVGNLREGRGDCSRTSEGLLALCAIAGRPCREWGMVAHPQPEDTGHSAVDIWLPDKERWAMLDVFLGFRAEDPDGTPLSTAELHRGLLADPEGTRLVGLRDEPPPTDSIRRHYGNPGVVPVSLVNNHPEWLVDHWTRQVERLHRPLGQLLQWALGLGPVYQVPDSPGHAELSRALRWLRARTLAGAGFLLVSGLALLRLAWWTRVRRPRVELAKFSDVGRQ